jgi:hypothetical protein
MGKKIFLVAPQVKNYFGKSEITPVRKPVNKFSVVPGASYCALARKGERSDAVVRTAMVGEGRHERRT